MRRIVVIVALAGFAVWPVAAHADRVTKGPLILSTDVVAGQRTTHLVHTVRRTTTLLPPYMPRLVLQFPPGTRVDRAGVPRCDLGELLAKGLPGCPVAARVGSGSILGRTDLNPEGIDSKVTILNGQIIRSRPAVLLFVRPKLGVSFAAVATLRGGRKRGVGIDVLFPPFKNFEIGLDISLSDFSLRFESAFLRAPCPAVYRATSYFFDEGTLTTSDRARCR